MNPAPLKITNQGSYLVAEFSGDFSVEAGKPVGDRAALASWFSRS